MLLSNGEPIWQQLAANDRLDFDLVSSFHASFYAQDQVAADVVENYYPTAREFHAYHERLFAKYRHKVLDERAVSVNNHGHYSHVHTESGTTYHASSVVFATGLGRPQNETIKDLDLSEIEGETLVFNGIGDTTNMMLAKAVPQGNEVVLLDNGFVNLDKYVVFETPGPKSQWYLPIFGVRTGKRYCLDLAQLEFHNVGPAVAAVLQGLVLNPARAAGAGVVHRPDLSASRFSRQVPGDLPPRCRSGQPRGASGSCQRDEWDQVLANRHVRGALRRRTRGAGS